MRQLVRLGVTKFLNATESMLRSSGVKWSLFCRIGVRKVNTSSYRSAYSASLAMKSSASIIGRLFYDRDLYACDILATIKLT